MKSLLGPRSLKMLRKCQQSPDDGKRPADVKASVGDIKQSFFARGNGTYIDL